MKDFKKSFKKNMILITACTALAATGPMVISTPVCAYDMEPQEMQEVPSPRWSYLSEVLASFSFGSLGRGNCLGGLFIDSNYDSKITLTLQKLKNGSWVDVKSWEQENSGAGEYIFEKAYYVSSKGTYRCSVTASVYSSSGKLLESTVCNSPSDTY